MINVIAFDADDTLWRNEPLYAEAKSRLKTLLSPYASQETVDEELDRREAANLPLYGYGIKSFTLSMIEEAIHLSDTKITGDEIGRIIDLGKEMLSLDVQLLNGVKETVSQLAESYSLMIITKGDLLDQERKLSQSGIDKYFECVEIVSEKDEMTYGKILMKYRIHPEHFLMVGNSLKSDILPVLKIGGYAVYIPAEMNWALDVVEDDPWPIDGHYEIEHLGQLPALVESLIGR
jgi:putative hydrolase of the HAD superfamily